LPALEPSGRDSQTSAPASSHDVPLSDPGQGIARHQSDIERIRIDPVDEPIRHIGWIEPAAVDETLRDTECHLSVVSNRPRWLAVRAVTEHLRYFAVL